MPRIAPLRTYSYLWLLAGVLMVRPIHGQTSSLFDCFAYDVPGKPLSGIGRCAPSWYCPNVKENDPTTVPRACPPSLECVTARATGTTCPAQGKYEPVPCPIDYYCPNPSKKILCPAGSFCPEGSREPSACNTLSHCPAGSHYQLYFGGLVFAVVLDVLVLCVYAVARHRHQRKQQQNKRDVQERKGSLQVVQAGSQKVVVLQQQVQQGNQDTSAADADPVSLLPSPLVTDIAATTLASAIPADSEWESTQKELLASYQRAFQHPQQQQQQQQPSFNPNGFLQASLPSMGFSFENLALTLPDGKTILSGVTGEMRARRLTAIMGPSGAGKTTFMNVLLGKVRRTAGSFLINGRELDPQHFKKIIGYVPQEDVMLRELTAREIITHAAATLLPSTWSKQERSQHVGAVIKTLGLSEVQYNLIGDENQRGVSGGQRKRVNIGIALAGAPLALFLDEPSSGLDSTSALSIMDTLKRVSALGTTVISVIHQPRFEIFQQFDDILLIAPGGKTAYLGPRETVVEYFELLGYTFTKHLNPCDILMDILSGQGPNDMHVHSSEELAEIWEQRVTDVQPLPSSSAALVQLLRPIGSPHRDVVKPHHFSDSVEARQEIQALTGRRTASVLRQMWLCHQRSLLQQQRRMGSFFLELAVSSLAGALMGIALLDFEGTLFRGVYWPTYSPLNAAVYSWVVPMISMSTAMSIGLAGAPAAVKIFGEEKPVFWREAAAGHNRFAYYLGKTLASTYRLLLSSLHFTATLYVLGKPRMAFETLFVVVLMLYYCVYGIATIVSLLTRRENAALLAVVICLFAGVFNGFGPQLPDARKWKMDFIWYTSYAFWATEALFTAETRPYRTLYNVEKSQANYEFVLEQFGFDLGMMVAIGSLYRVVAYLLLRFLHRDKQK